MAGRRVLMDSVQVGQAQLTRRYLAPSYQYDRIKYAYPLQLLSYILGNGTSSRLYQELVVKKKLAVSAGAWYSPDNLGPSVFGFYASPKNSVHISEVERNTRTDNSDPARMRELVSNTMFLTYPYRIPIIGWRHEIEKLDKTAALEFYRKWYSPNNAVLIVAGDVNPNAVSYTHLRAHET